MKISWKAPVINSQIPKKISKREPEIIKPLRRERR